MSKNIVSILFPKNNIHSNNNTLYNNASYILEFDEEDLKY